MCNSCWVPHISAIPGWFSAHDMALFDWILETQNRAGIQGDLVELGAYLGKSACLIGGHVLPGQKFTVVDTFGADVDDVANQLENEREYPTLTRQAFEANYLRFHPELPSVVQGLSSEISRLAEPASVRFFHIDASHQYEHVRTDVENAGRLCSPHGVVVLDDYRSAHAPGVAAATWEAVTTGSLRPILATASKFYATPGDPGRLQDQIAPFIAGRRDMVLDRQFVCGMPLLLVGQSESLSRLATFIPPAWLPFAVRLRDRLRRVLAGVAAEEHDGPAPP